MAASGLGAVLGAVTVAARGTLRHRGRVVTIGGIVFFSPSSPSVIHTHLFCRNACCCLKATAAF